MTYRIQLTPTAAEAFCCLHPEVRKQLKTGMMELANKPYSGKYLQNELYGFWTYKIKRYRIIYKIDNNNKLLKVYMIGHRRDIYNLFSELISQEKTRE